MKKKIVTSALAACMLVPAALTFGACGKDPDPTFTIGQNITTSADAIIQSLTTNVYNALPAGNYSVAQLKQQNSSFKYYVEIGTVDEFDDIDSITLGGTTMLDDEEFSLSVGNNAFIKDECFFEEDDRLYVAAPIIAFEAVNNTKIKINNKTFDFELLTPASKISFASITGSDSNITVESITNGEYNIQLSSGQSYLNLNFNSNPTSPIITKKIWGGESFSYGINSATNPLMLYPCYTETAFTPAQLAERDGKTLNYEVYISGVGIYSVNLNIDLITA
ncbi:MAG: hypothetical protein IJ415_00930 [Clostridia bacterium]|nr:hypothetical protein [Clostridia bacterium]